MNTARFAGLLAALALGAALVAHDSILVVRLLLVVLAFAAIVLTRSWMRTPLALAVLPVATFAHDSRIEVRLAAVAAAAVAGMAAEIVVPRWRAEQRTVPDPDLLALDVEPVTSTGLRRQVDRAIARARRSGQLVLVIVIDTLDASADPPLDLLGRVRSLVRLDDTVVYRDDAGESVVIAVVDGMADLEVLLDRVRDGFSGGIGGGGVAGASFPADGESAPDLLDSLRRPALAATAGKSAGPGPDRAVSSRSSVARADNSRSSTARSETGAGETGKPKNGGAGSGSTDAGSGERR